MSWTGIQTGRWTGNEARIHLNLVSEMLDPVINFTNVLVSEFEKIDNRLDEMLENVDDLMGRDLQTDHVTDRGFGPSLNLSRSILK